MADSIRSRAADTPRDKLGDIHFPSKFPCIPDVALHTRGVDFTVAAVPVVSGEVNKLVVDIVEIIKGSGKT